MISLKESPMYTCTMGDPGSPMTRDILQKAINLLNKTKGIKIFFSSMLRGNKILAGEEVNEMLQCNENEDGFIVPLEFRNELLEFKNGYQEVTLDHLLNPILNCFSWDLRK